MSAAASPAKSALASAGPGASDRLGRGGRLYVYAILPAGVPLPAGLCGLGGAPVTALSYRAVAAAVSELPDGELAPPAPLPEHVRRHEEVVEAIRAAGPALPARFGTVLGGPGAVATALARRYAALGADLARLGDKVELGLAVLWDAPPREAASDAAGRPLGCEEAAAGPGARYLQRRLAEHRREEQLRSQAGAVARQVEAALRGHVVESQSSLLPTAGLALRAAYLLQPAQLDGFRTAFAALRLARADLRFLLSGPWPPYSFVTPPERPASSGEESQASARNDGGDEGQPGPGRDRGEVER